MIFGKSHAPTGWSCKWRYLDTKLHYMSIKLGFKAQKEGKLGPALAPAGWLLLCFGSSEVMPKQKTEHTQQAISLEPLGRLLDTKAKAPTSQVRCGFTCGLLWNPEGPFRLPIWN